MSLQNTVRYVGHVGQRTGYGRAAEDFCKALARAGIELEIVPMATRGVEQELLSELETFMYKPRERRRVAATIVHTLPADCGKALEYVEKNIGTAAKRIAYTTWETMTYPGATDLREDFDEVWTPSRASQQALRGGVTASDSPAKVHAIPHCFDPGHPVIQRARDYGAERPGHPGTSGRTRLYWIGAWNVRKNPVGIIRAFAHAFEPSDDVELVMHTPGGDTVQFYAALAQTGLSQTEMASVQFSNAYLSDEEIWNIHAQGDIFVSASRGEAWHLPAFEAMLAGKWVIATAELGSDDYLYHPGADRETNAFLIKGRGDLAHVSVKTQAGAVPGQIGFVTEGAKGLTSKCLWTEPSLLELSLEMHTAVNNCVRRGKMMHVGYDPVAHFGYEAVAKLMIERIRA